MEVSFLFYLFFCCFFTLGTILTFLFFFFFRDGLPRRGLDLEFRNGGKFFILFLFFCCFFTLGTILTFLFFFFFRDGLPQRGLDLEFRNGGKFFILFLFFCYFFTFRNDTNVPLFSFFLRAGSSWLSSSLNLSRLGSARSSQAVFFKTRLVQAKPHLLKARLGSAWYNFSSQAQARPRLSSSQLVRSFKYIFYIKILNFCY